MANGGRGAERWLEAPHDGRRDRGSRRLGDHLPLLWPLDDSPASLVTVGAFIDAGAFSAWNLTVGRKHERLAAAGLWAMAAFRTYLVFHNLRTERRAARR